MKRTLDWITDALMVLLVFTLVSLAVKLFPEFFD